MNRSHLVPLRRALAALGVSALFWNCSPVPAARLPVGEACQAQLECLSGFCADRVCCDAPCTELCQSCNAASPGTCTPSGPSDLEAGCGAYRCGGADGGCETSCVSSSQCQPDAFCEAGLCRARRMLGSSCTATTDCLGGLCSDGVCCDSACSGPCDACDRAGMEGTCGPAAAGSAGNPACAPYLCPGDGPACATSCRTNGDCASTHSCEAGQCLPRVPNGGACSSAAACESSQCVGGRCCDRACQGGCESCALAGQEGRCALLSRGSAGAPSCMPFVCDGVIAGCPQSCAADAACSIDNYCANGACLPRELKGSACASSSECRSGACADGFCCESACADLCQSCGLAGTEGSCTAYGNRTDPQSECGLTLCNGASACISACAADSDCKGGNYCGSGTCAPKKPDGVSCTATGECQSGVCADGFCCQTACGALCQSCGLAGAQGSCTTFSNRTDPQSECGLTYCNGASACIAACAGDSDCKSGNYCAGGACTARQGNGQACGGANMCGSGNCVDGVCCDSACSGRCDACNLAGSVGSCSPMPAGTVGAPSCSPFVCDGSSVACPAGCTSDAQCAPGLSCADGDCSPVPLGLVVPFAGSGLPPGWLFAEGQVLTRAAYPALFAAIGDSYGAPDGLSFNLPDLRGRFPLGKAAGGTGAVLGERGGALIMGGGTLSLPPLTPAFTVPAVNYSVNGLAAHGHTVSFPTQTFRAGSSTSIQPSTFSLNGTCGSACSNGWTSFTVPSRSASAGSVTPTATLDVATAAFRVVRYVIKVSSSSAVPCGAVWGNAATTAPAGAADANGSPASGDLATCLDAAYAGALPDLRGRFALGRSTSGIGATLNAAGGALDIAHQATRTIPSTGVTVPSVSIAITPPDHVHTSSWVNFGHEPGAVNSSLVAGDSPANSGPRRESAASQTATTNGGGGSSTSDAASGTAPAAVFSPAFRALNQVAFLSASAGLTPGLLAPFAGSTTPPGWLLADGSCVSRTTYGALFSAIGTLHGGCDGVNNFGLPDLRGRFPLGKAASGTGSSLGVAGGALNFQPSVGFGNFTPSFTWAPPPYAFNLPNHTHDANINGGSGADTCCANFTGIPNRGVWSYVSDPAGAQTVSTNTPAGQLVSGTPTGATTGLFPAETPAYVALNFLIKY